MKQPYPSYCSSIGSTYRAPRQDQSKVREGYEHFRWKGYGMRPLYNAVRMMASAFWAAAKTDLDSRMDRYCKCGKVDSHGFQTPFGVTRVPLVVGRCVRLPWTVEDISYEEKISRPRFDMTKDERVHADDDCRETSGNTPRCAFVLYGDRSGTRRWLMEPGEAIDD